MAKKKPFITPTNSPEFRGLISKQREIIIEGTYRITETRRGFYPEKLIKVRDGLTWYGKQAYRNEWVTLDVYGQPQDGHVFLECLTLKFDTLKEAREALFEIASPTKIIHSWPQ